jgi:hypothetical protein
VCVSLTFNGLSLDDLKSNVCATYATGVGNLLKNNEKEDKVATAPFLEKRCAHRGRYKNETFYAKSIYKKVILLEGLCELV